MGDVCFLAEGKHKTIGFPSGSGSNAAMYLVARLFTDAVFNQDIRAIQLIINRIDGGLPKDTEIDDYQTQFGDCLNAVMNCTNGTQLKVMPSDTVMMALCKSLYDLAIQDIYYDYSKDRPCKPSPDKKKERDAAMRIVLDRTGGRKTLSSMQKEKEEVEIADWIVALPEKA